jgi:hypothetical protein
MRNDGMGLSGTILTLPQMENQIRAMLAIEIIYYLSITAIEISILFFYLRIGKLTSSLTREHV